MAFRLQLQAVPGATMNESRLQVDTVRYFTLQSPNDLPVRRRGPSWAPTPTRARPPRSPPPGRDEPGGGRSAPGRSRTCDLSLRRRLLYPLSYWGRASSAPVILPRGAGSAASRLDRSSGRSDEPRAPRSRGRASPPSPRRGDGRRRGPSCRSRRTPPGRRARGPRPTSARALLSVPGLVPEPYAAVGLGVGERVEVEGGGHHRQVDAGGQPRQHGRAHGRADDRARGEVGEQRRPSRRRSPR